MAESGGATQLIFPGFAGVYDSLGAWSYTFIRFCAAAILIPHGYGKLFGGAAPLVAKFVLTPLGFPAPLGWAYFLGLLEFFGCIMLAIGFLTRPIALMLTVETAIITFAWSFRHGYAFTSPHGGYEYPLLLMLLYFAMIFRGGGRYSVDHLIGREF